MAEYPKCLLRNGSSFEWDGRLYDVLTVEDAEAEKQAKAEGWQTSDQVLNAIADPLDHDGSGKKGGPLPKAEKPVPTRQGKRKGK